LAVEVVQMGMAENAVLNAEEEEEYDDARNREVQEE
jgi:hypothetical protein